MILFRCRVKKYPILQWPYREGLRIDEAMHPLTTLVTGLYGKKLPNQNGAPLRLIVPWKYGFKSAKAIVNIKLVEKMTNFVLDEIFSKRIRILFKC